MTNILSSNRSSRAWLSLFLLTGCWPVIAGPYRAIPGKFQAPSGAQLLAGLKIPEAPQSCETLECKWWEELRTAAIGVNQAQTRKDQTLSEAYEKARRAGKIIESETDVLPKDVLSRLYGDLESTSANYLKVLREGEEKSYRVPVADALSLRPIIVRKRKAMYTEEARAAKVQGSVLLSVVYQRNGEVSSIKVVRGLEKGLTEMAIEAAKYILFLPGVKDGEFVSVRGNLEFNFSLY